MSGLFDLHGHVALVTGGNGGIGLGLARGLARAGASLAIWGRNQDKNSAAVAELEGLGARAVALQCDVSREEEIRAGVERTVEELGRIDSCFANAGFGFARPFLEMTAEDWQKVMDVNLKGVFLTFREVLRHMVARGGGGKLVAISSIGQLHGMPRQEQYAASKGGVTSLVRSLAVEFARHDIQANAILPGWIETDATAPLKRWKKLEEQILHRTPLRRWGRPDDLEGIAVYLASPASRFHTGDVIVIDGGYTAF